MRTPRARAVALAASFVAALAAGPAGAQVTPLFVGNLEILAEEPLDLTAPLRVRLYSRDPSAFRGRLPGVVRVDDDSALVDLTPARPTVATEADLETRGSSWIVDFESEEVEALYRELAELHGPAPKPIHIAAFVQQRMRVSMGRSFDTASAVARSRTGDCTEHAVLLAALARRSGYPAVVVIGTLVAEGHGTWSSKQLDGVGHAWTEIHSEGRWRLLDATPLGDCERIAYIPEGVLRQEGPSYGLGLAKLLGDSTRRIEVLGNAPPPGTHR